MISVKCGAYPVGERQWIPVITIAGFQTRIEGLTFTTAQAAKLISREIAEAIEKNVNEDHLTS